MRLLVLAASVLGTAMADTCHTQTGVTRDFDQATTCEENWNLTSPTTTAEVFTSGTGGCDVTQTTLQWCLDEAPTCWACKDANGDDIAVAGGNATKAGCEGTTGQVWTAVTSATDKSMCGKCTTTNSTATNVEFCPWSQLAADDLVNCGTCSGTVGGVAPVTAKLGGRSLPTAGWAKEDVCNDTNHTTATSQNECGSCSDTNLTKAAGSCACANLLNDACPSAFDNEDTCEAGFCNNNAAGSSTTCGYCQITHVEPATADSLLVAAAATNCAPAVQGTGFFDVSTAYWNNNLDECVDTAITVEADCVTPAANKATYEWVGTITDIGGGEVLGYCQITKVDGDDTPGNTLDTADVNNCTVTANVGHTNTNAVWKTDTTYQGANVASCVDPTLNSKSLCDAKEAAEDDTNPTAEYLWVDAIPGTWSPADTGAWTVGCGAYCSDSNTNTTSATCGSCADGTSLTEAACNTASSTWTNKWKVPGKCTDDQDSATASTEDACGKCEFTHNTTDGAAITTSGQCGSQAGGTWVDNSGNANAKDYCHATGQTTKAQCEAYTDANGQVAWVTSEVDFVFAAYEWTSAFKNQCEGVTDCVWTSAATGCATADWTEYGWGLAIGGSTTEVPNVTKADCTGDGKVVVNKNTTISFGSVTTAPTTGYTNGWNSTASNNGWTTTNTYFCETEDCATCAKLNSEGDAAPTPAPSDSDDEEDSALGAAAATAAAVAGAAALLL